MKTGVWLCFPLVIITYKISGTFFIFYQTYNLQNKWLEIIEWFSSYFSALLDDKHHYNSLKWKLQYNIFCFLLTDWKIRVIIWIFSQIRTPRRPNAIKPWQLITLKHSSPIQPPHTIILYLGHKDWGISRFKNTNNE